MNSRTEDDFVESQESAALAIIATCEMSGPLLHKFLVRRCDSSGVDYDATYTCRLTEAFPLQLQGTRIGT